MTQNELKEQLLLSELAYFRAGSEISRELSGEFIHLPEFTDLASGCVLHNVQLDIVQMDKVQLDNETSDLDAWLNDVETKFRSVGASECRFYLTESNERYDNTLIRHGYNKVLEAGLVCQISHAQVTKNTINGELIAILDNDSQQVKKSLYQKASIGPDGHNMKNGRYADLERKKNNEQYMTSYIYWLDDKPAGAVSLAINKNFARLKNLLVHPELRGCGIGKNMVYLLMKEALQQGAKWFGVYALKDSRAHKLYRTCGMHDLLMQIEWSKKL